MRVKFLKAYKQYKAGEVTVIDDALATGLLLSGLAMSSKDMQAMDYQTKALDEEQANGKPTELRTN